MLKNLPFLIMVIATMASRSTDKRNHDDPYAYIGEYCSQAKFVKVPCLKQFCAEIDQAIHVWQGNNASIASKFIDLYNDQAKWIDGPTWIAAFVSSFNVTFGGEKDGNNFTAYYNLQLPFDPYGYAPSIMTGSLKGYIHEAKYDLDGVCDRELEVFLIAENFYRQHCSIRGNPFRFAPLPYRYWLYLFNDPTIDIFQRYVYYLPLILFPYLLIVVPFAILNTYLVYRVAKDCPGVRFHLAQSIGDIGDLVIRAGYGSYGVFAPLFAWNNFCISASDSFLTAIGPFFALLSVFSLTLLLYDRYVATCHPEKYSMWTEKRGKLLALVIALSTGPMICSLFNDFWRNSFYINRSFQMLYWFYPFIYFTTCMGSFFYFGIKTFKAAKNYQPPAGLSSAAQSVQKMKRFHQLTMSVLILNFFYTLLLSITYLEFSLWRICQILYPENYVNGNYHGFCNIMMKINNNYNYYRWMSVLTIFTSNSGLLFHCIFSKCYRDEAKKVFYEFVGIIRCKHSTTVVPMHAYK